MSSGETPIPPAPGSTSDGNQPCDNTVQTCPQEEANSAGTENSNSNSSQPPNCPTDFTIGTPCKIVKTDGGRITITAKDLDGFSGGSFIWTSNSAKIRLQNPNSATVTVEGLNDVSSARDAEAIKVTRTQAGCGPIEKTVNITVAKVTFSASANQRYGFDDFDTPADPADNHICIKKSDHTFVKVTIEGGAVGTDFEFVCTSNVICTTVAPPGSAEFDLRLNSGTTNKGNTDLKANTVCDTSKEFAKLKVHVYKQRDVDVVVAKIDHPTTTYLRFATADYASHAATANAKLKEAVVKYNITNLSDTNAITPVTFASGNGVLSYDIGSGGGADLTTIDNAMTGTGSNVVRVAIIKDMKSYYYLSAAAAIGDTSLTVTGNRKVYFNVGDTAPLGTGVGMERITITAIAGQTITCDPLTKAHTAGSEIEFPAAGWASDPILIKEGTGAESVVKWTILHEVGHKDKGLNLRDIEDRTNFMHFSQSWTDYRLRFCPRQKHYAPRDKQNQWETIPRPRI